MRRLVQFEWHGNVLYGLDDRGTIWISESGATWEKFSQLPNETDEEVCEHDAELEAIPAKGGGRWDF